MNVLNKVNVPNVKFLQWVLKFEPLKRLSLFTQSFFMTLFF